jgi:hypothetical protein
VGEEGDCVLEGGFHGGPRFDFDCIEGEQRQEQ